jgi:uncharacterized protein YdaU (DUF1376 family)
VNYYEHHLGDYLRDAGHLTFIEDAAYRRLIDAYYIQEKPLPPDVRECQKLARCQTAKERKAVAYVLAKFFVQNDDGFHQKRCDEVIADYHESEPEREAKKANDKERQRRARDRRRRLYEELRKHGITPNFNATTRELEDQLSRVTVTEQPCDGHDESHEASRVTTRLPTPHSPLPNNKSKNPQPPLKGADVAQSRSERKPRSVTDASLDAWNRTLEAIDSVRGDKSKTWADADASLNDELAIQAIRTTGGHKLIGDRTQFTQANLKRLFRESYESNLQNSKEKEGPNGHKADQTPHNPEIGSLLSQAAKGMAQ